MEGIATVIAKSSDLIEKGIKKATKPFSQSTFRCLQDLASTWPTDATCSFLENITTSYGYSNVQSSKSMKWIICHTLMAYDPAIQAEIWLKLWKNQVSELHNSYLTK